MVTNVFFLYLLTSLVTFECIIFPTLQYFSTDTMRDKYMGSKNCYLANTEEWEKTLKRCQQQVLFHNILLLRDILNIELGASNVQQAKVDQGERCCRNS